MTDEQIIKAVDVCGEDFVFVSDIDILVKEMTGVQE